MFWSITTTQIMIACGAPVEDLKRLSNGFRLIRTSQSSALPSCTIGWIASPNPSGLIQLMFKEIPMPGTQTVAQLCGSDRPPQHSYLPALAPMATPRGRGLPQPLNVCPDDNSQSSRRDPPPTDAVVGGDSCWRMGWRILSTPIPDHPMGACPSTSNPVNSDGGHPAPPGP